MPMSTRIPPRLVWKACKLQVLFVVFLFFAVSVCEQSCVDVDGRCLCPPEYYLHSNGSCVHLGSLGSINRFNMNPPEPQDTRIRDVVGQDVCTDIDDCKYMLQLPKPIFFNGGKYSELGIDSNGHVDATRLNDQYCDHTYPTDTLLFANCFTDHNINEGGDIYFRYSENQDDLDFFTAKMNHCLEFHPTSAVIVTYDRVVAYGQPHANTATHQLVVLWADDEENENIIVQFHYERMNWTTSYCNLWKIGFFDDTSGVKWIPSCLDGISTANVNTINVSKILEEKAEIFAIINSTGAIEYVPKASCECYQMWNSSISCGEVICSRSNCNHHGNCTQFMNSFSCVCDEGRAGTFCDKCSHDWFDDDGNCVEICPGRKYPNQSSFCVNCTTNCVTCTNSIDCSDCVSGYFYDHHLQECVFPCPPNHFDDDFSGTCEDCYPNCTRCSSSLETGCEECESWLFIHHHPISCVASCPDGHFEDSTSPPHKCIDCPLNCTECSQNDICTLCDPGFLIQPTRTCDVTCPPRTRPSLTLPPRCVDCSSGCLVCDETSCFDCEIGLLLDHHSQNCVGDCPSGHYNDTENCYDCFVNCSKCIDSTLDGCTGCIDGLFFNLYPVSCVRECPDGLVADEVSNKCVNCSLNCVNCSFSECFECESSYFIDHHSGQCMNPCPPRHYEDTSSGKCEDCPSSSCSVCSETGCDECDSGFVLNSQKICVECSLNCIDCSITECFECEVPFFIDHHTGQCVNPCPPRHYEDSTLGKCEDCTSNCTVCSESGCEECDSAANFVLNSEDLCVEDVSISNPSNPVAVILSLAISGGILFGCLCVILVIVIIVVVLVVVVRARKNGDRQTEDVELAILKTDGNEMEKDVVTTPEGKSDEKIVVENKNVQQNDDQESKEEQKGDQKVAFLEKMPEETALNDKKPDQLQAKDVDYEQQTSGIEEEKMKIMEDTNNKRREELEKEKKLEEKRKWKLEEKNRKKLEKEKKKEEKKRKKAEQKRLKREKKRRTQGPKLVINPEKPVQLRICVVGDGGVGKTCLLHVYKDGIFPDMYLPTVFENYRKDVKMTVGGTEYDIEVSLKDTAGQEDYKNIRTLSYHDVDVFLLCFDVTAEETLSNACFQWMKELLEYVKSKSQIILIGLKTDLLKEEVPGAFRNICEKKANSLGVSCYMECSAMLNENVNEIFERAFSVLYYSGRQ